MKRIAGLLLFFIFIIPFLLSPFVVLLRILINPDQRAKDGLRSMDMTTNCLWFSGSSYESVSSHSWREYCNLPSAWWANFVIHFTDNIQQGHCAGANKIEQPIVDFVNSR